ncbi:conserved hypothetical protein [Histoplasma capsulatum G186AR]|uniref:L-type lectin-like domain-containing protein n=1 Tax=Ajellomyces capsulatus (strain G186AR / H82 / ATCC MYA-2454 / RMSCC 2432) TaxID=447093 RepID=C0NWB7_AJECG|nr:uncharacterized protein HCBG_07447 [Histoplasma capsulatum G186AR]EEH04222.1 conserved hypothetical protein [Histoplasma capsulatum G186AR]
MVRPWGITKFLALACAFVSVSQANSIVEKASFGHNGKISADKHVIPGWQLSGTGHTPHKLSDRVILTPPYTGNKRGSLWSEQPFDGSEWIVDFDFRSNGAERGGGNLQLWYVKDGLSKISTASVYTAGRFDGFVLVIDVPNGRGGSVRGFLNDGTTDYNSANVDGLAFGHCDYSYRNLGRLSHIQIKQTKSTFEQQVTGAGGNGIDNRLNDLQNRLQGLVGTADRLLTEIQSLSRKVDERHQDTLQKLTANRDQVGQMEQRMQRIENMLQAVQKGVTDSDLKNQLHRLQDALKTSHTGVIEQLQSTSHQILSSKPRMGFFIFLIVVCQLGLAASYIVYKRRRANMPKKFL